MECASLKNSIAHLQSENLQFSTFVSDRHTTIAKNMQEQMPHIAHYFDLLHLKKSKFKHLRIWSLVGLTIKLTETKGYDFYFIFVEIHKELTNLAKENDCKSLEPWVQPCVNHLFWSATSTFDGNGNVIWAKFK